MFLIRVGLTGDLGSFSGRRLGVTVVEVTRAEGVRRVRNIIKAWEDAGNVEVLSIKETEDTWVVTTKHYGEVVYTTTLALVDEVHLDGDWPHYIAAGSVILGHLSYSWRKQKMSGG